MKTLHSLGLLLMLALIAGCGCTTSSLKSNPGYADIDYPKHKQIEKESGVNLGPALIGIAGWFMSLDDELEKNNFLKNLDGVRVSTYAVHEQDAIIRQSIDKTANDLIAKGWEKVVSVKETGERVEILAKMEQETLQGLVVLVTDKSEAVFVNVIGEFQRQDVESMVAFAQSQQ